MSMTDGFARQHCRKGVSSVRTLETFGSSLGSLSLTKALKIPVIGRLGGFVKVNCLLLKSRFFPVRVPFTRPMESVPLEMAAEKLPSLWFTGKDGAAERRKSA
jgi:hypothetical protein